MSAYKLVYKEDGLGEAKEFEFEAEDASKALIIAHSEAAARPAELWRNGERVCTIKRSSEARDVWEVT